MRLWLYSSWTSRTAELRILVSKGDLEMGKKQLSLYFHVPFCVSKCAYCSFYSSPRFSDEFRNSYAEALCRHVKSFPCPEDYIVKTVYFGGGTPPLVGVDNLIKILNAAKGIFCFESGVEITLEVNPLTVDLSDLKALKSAGFNRLSMGLQSANPSSLKRLCRAHGTDDFVRCFTDAGTAGFDNINVDIIFALPDETLTELEHTLRFVADFKPKHISAYSLSLEEGTPLHSRRGEYRFPTEDEEEEQYKVICEFLREKGYAHYEISNFALDGFESKHNCVYWKRGEYVGFGASAHSFFEGKRFSILPDAERYISLVEEGFYAPTDFESASFIGSAEAEEERIMLGLRLSEGIEFNRPIPKQIFDGGYAELKNGRLRLTEKGFRVSNTLISLLTE